MNRTCPFCKKMFSTDNRQKVYCCRICKDRHRRERLRAGTDSVVAEGSIGVVEPLPPIHLNQRAKKESLGYHGTLNDGINCSRCKFSCLSIGARRYVKTGGNYCRKHSFSIGEYGTCRDFTPPSSGLSDMSFD